MGDPRPHILNHRGISHEESVAVKIAGRGTLQIPGKHAGPVGLNDAGGNLIRINHGSSLNSFGANEAAAALQSLRNGGRRPVAVFLDPLGAQAHSSTNTEYLAQLPLQASLKEPQQSPPQVQKCPAVAFRKLHQMECCSAADGSSTPSDGSPVSHVVYAARDQQEYTVSHSHESQQTHVVRKQVLFCGWDGPRVGVRSSLASFRSYMARVGKTAQQMVGALISCLEIGETCYVENCLTKLWQLKPRQAHPQVELKVASTGLFVLAEGWNGDWDRISRASVVISEDLHGNNILSEVRLEGSACDVVFALTADRPSQVLHEKTFDLETKEANLHYILSQISAVICFINDAFDEEINTDTNHELTSRFQSIPPQATKPLCQRPPLQDDAVQEACTQTPDCFYHTHFTKAYDREKLIKYLRDYDENDALCSYPAKMPLIIVPKTGNLKIPGHVVLRGKPEGVRGPKTGTARWGADGKNGFLIVGAEANAKQNKQLEERYEKGIYPVAIFLITNPASFELDSRFSSLPDEIWTDSSWEIHEQPLHSNATELVGPNGYSYQPPAGWRWIEIRQKKDERKRCRQESRNLKRARGTPSRIVLMNMRKVIIDFKQEVKNGVLDLGTKRCTMNAADATTLL